MTEIDLTIIVAIGATFFLAGMVKGVTGMGLPTVAMGILGALISPLAAAGLLLIPSFVTNVWQLYAGPSFLPLISRLWPMMMAICAGTIISASTLADGSGRVTTTALGLALVAYAGYTLSARQIRVPESVEAWLSPLIGAATGVVTGTTGVFVIPAVPYLQALGLHRDDLVQALGLSFTVSTIALAIGLGVNGAFEAQGLVLSVLALMPALAGMWAGQALRGRISPSAFRRLFLIFLLLLGTEMSLRPLWS